jgi:hypothetical protein
MRARLKEQELYYELISLFLLYSDNFLKAGMSIGCMEKSYSNSNCISFKLKYSTL